MRKIALLLAILVSMNASVFGFATIVQAIKGGDTISFSTNTQDVDVYLNDRMISKVSGSFFYKVKRDGQPKVFTFKKAGYKTVEIELSTSFDNMFWGNLLVGGSFGSSTDSWLTSNSQEYSPNQYYVSMEKG